MMNQMSDVQKIVLNLTATHLFDRKIDIPENVDWKAVYKEAKAQSVVPIVFSVAEPFMDVDSLAFWKSIVVPKVANDIRINCEHAELHDVMSEAGIPYTTLKGSVSASYYPEPMQRSMGDVDFIVHENDLSRAGEALENAGFQLKSDKEENFHFVYRRQTVGPAFYGKSGAFGGKADVSVWEMHWNVNGIPNGQVGDKIKEYLNDIIETAVESDMDCGTFMVPDTFHHGLVLLLHTASHLTSEGVGLRHLCDWAVFAASMSNDEFVGLFEKKLKSIGMWKFAQLLTACSVKYLNCPERSWVSIKDDDLLENTIIDILNGGNFGKKDDDRTRQIKYISNRDKGTVDDKGALRQAASTVNQKARSELGFVRKAPVLAPIGWVVIGIRYVKMLVSGQRELDSRKTLQEAGRRKDIYKQFNLFEAEK